jgi:cobalt/nickel transport system permease protein
VAGGKRLSVFIALGIAVATAVVVLVAPFANANPDGFEKVSAEHGIDTNATEHLLADGPLADYSPRGVDNDFAATGIAGVIGVVVTFVVGAGTVVVVRRLRSRS